MKNINYKILIIGIAFQSTLLINCGKIKNGKMKNKTSEKCCFYGSLFTMGSAIACYKFRKNKKFCYNKKYKKLILNDRKLKSVQYLLTFTSVFLYGKYINYKINSCLDFVDSSITNILTGVVALGGKNNAWAWGALIHKEFGEERYEKVKDNYEKNIKW